MKDHGGLHDERRVFLSDEKNDNSLNCVVSKVKVVQVAPHVRKWFCLVNKFLIERAIRACSFSIFCNAD